MTTEKPRVKAGYVYIHKLGKFGYVAYLRRLGRHPVLGKPKDSFTLTSLILKADFEKKEIETLNTIYYWED